MNIGVIQGRLSPPIEGFQECPVDWKREFDLLGRLGLTHIEWIVTKENFYTNPIHNVDLNGYPISSVCADFMVDENFLDQEYLSFYLNPICELAVKNNIDFVTIPLLEKSSVVDDNIRDEFKEIIYPYFDRYPKIRFLIEAELGIDELKDILNDYWNKPLDLGITYDTGNITSFGLDHDLYIDSFRDNIKQVHIKDRIRNPLETVIPGEGDTDFNLIFAMLKYIKYDGIYTLQTARENDGDEEGTIKRHQQIIERFYTKSLYTSVPVKYKSSSYTIKEY